MQRVYRDTIVNDSGYAHLGDVNVSGDIHIHQYVVQEGQLRLSNSFHVSRPEAAYQQVLDAALHASVINTNLSISAPQLNLSLGEIFGQIRDPIVDLRLSRILRHRRMMAGHYIPLPGSARTLLQRWADKRVSSTVILGGSQSQRLLIQDTSVEIIQIIQKTNTPILYLVDVLGSGRNQGLSCTGTLDTLTVQAIKQNVNFNNERSFSAIIARARDAGSLEARVGVLASALEGLTEVYILVSVFTAWPNRQDLLLLETFTMLLRQLATRPSMTRVKIVLAGSIRTAEISHPLEGENRYSTVSVINPGQKAVSTPRKRRPATQLSRPPKIMKLR